METSRCNTAAKRPHSLMDAHISCALKTLQGQENFTDTNPGEQSYLIFPTRFHHPVPPLHRIPRVLDTGTCMGRLSQNVTNEERQTTFGFEIDNSWASSHPAQQPLPSATVSETQVSHLRPEFKVGCLVILISAGGILSVQAALRGERKTELTHDVLFKAYTVLNYISLVLGLALFLLSIRRSNIPHLDMIIKFTTWISLGSITYAIACATSIILVILVLLAPLLMVFLLFIFSFCSRKN